MGLKILAVIIAMVCTVFALSWLLYLFIINFETIIITAGLICCIIGGIIAILPKKKSAQESKDNTASDNSLKYDPITLENTYKLIRNSLCFILGETYDIIKVRKPASYSQLDSPTHYSIVGNVPIYHYLVSKQGGEVDVYTAMGILQNSFEQKLNNNELPGLSQSVFFYNGQAYPALMVDAVRDLGSFIQVNIAVASEYYCKYRQQRLYKNTISSNDSNFFDNDF